LLHFLVIEMKMGMADISVLLCAYRESIEEFEIAVRSVVLQTYPPRQLVIVDDSGELRFSILCQNLRETLLTNLGIELTYVGNSCNLGLVASLNLGMRKVYCQYVARMDADDVSLPYRFHKQIQLLNSGFDIVGAGITLFDDENNLRDVYYPTTRVGILYSLLRNNPIAHPAVMLRAEVVRALNGYNEIDCAEDLDLWMRAYLAGYRITNSSSVLLLRRIHQQQISLKYANEQAQSARELQRLFLNRLIR
jgi:glycosyltransferase involved in cell wall biosynthesis